MWFDEESVVKETDYYYYDIAIPSDHDMSSYLYFTVESYYQAYIPSDCWDPSSYGFPIVYFSVSNDRTGERWYKYYYEQYHNPMLIGPSKYQAGDNFSITVSNDWYGSPARDFTVMLYSKIPEGTVWITNVDGYSNMMNMDGSLPTGFIESNYTTGIEHSMPNDPLRCFYY
jgi:hypothetical protein